MNRRVAECIAGLLCIGLVPATVLAGDSASYVVQCTIPAIPGVNAPLNEEERFVPPSSVRLDEPEEGRLEETQPAAGEESDAPVRITTIYER